MLRMSQRRVYGAAGSNVDKLCIDGGKLGPHRRQLQAAEGLEIFMALHVVSPDDVSTLIGSTVRVIEMMLKW